MKRRAIRDLFHCGNQCIDVPSVQREGVYFGLTIGPHDQLLVEASSIAISIAEQRLYESASFEVES